MDISVIIVNYNTCRITCQCLDSIFKYTKGIEFEVIVVDNDSNNDDSKEVLRNYPNIIFVQSYENLGFGKANNLGYKYTRGDFVLLLNSDTYLLNNALKFFVDRFKLLPSSIGCIGASLLSPDLQYVNSYGYFPDIKNILKLAILSYAKKLGLCKMKSCKVSCIKEKYVPYIVGADLCIRRSVIDELGLFDKDFFMYYEDVELQKRYSTHSYLSYIIDGPQIVHLECVSSNQTKKVYSYLNRQIYLDGMFLYFKKLYSFPKYLLFRLIFLLNLPAYINRRYTFNENVKLLKTFFSI